MIGYYAVGGGLGHLTRGRRVLDALGIDATFITASSYAEDVRVTGGRPVIFIPRQLAGDVDAHRDWLRSLALSRLIVDTFPCGIQGELSGLDLPMDLVARDLRWDAYRKAVPFEPPQFEHVYEVEKESRSAVAPAAALLDFWLIVHSGPEEEVRELIAYAQELMRVDGAPEKTLVATRCSFEMPRGFEHIDAYPVTHLFPSAAKILSAAGFNVMLETEPFRDKHHVLPFARPFDDQFARAAARKRFASSLVTT